MKFTILSTSILASALLGACTKSDSDSSESTGAVDTSVLAGTLSLNVVPSLDAAAGTAASSLRLAPVGTAPDFSTIQTDYLTSASKQTLFGTTSSKGQYCQAISQTARALSKFLSNDSNLCIFKEVENARKAAASYISITSGTIGDEGLFGQLTADKKIKIAATTSDGTMDVLFDIKGNAGDKEADYQLTMRQCVGGSLWGVQVVSIERSTGKVTIRQNMSEDGAPKEDLFTGYLNEEGSAWDLAQAREFMYDMYRDNSYESVWTKFTADGQIITNTLSGNNNNSRVAAQVVGEGAQTLSVQSAFFKDLSLSSSSGMEFSSTGYVAATAADLSALVDAIPTTGRFYAPQTSVALPLFDELNCEMSSPDIEGDLDLSAGEESFSKVCDNALTDSQDETDANGNPVLRSGAYCNL